MPAVPKETNQLKVLMNTPMGNGRLPVLRLRPYAADGPSPSTNFSIRLVDSLGTLFISRPNDPSQIPDTLDSLFEKLRDTHWTIQRIQRFPNKPDFTPKFLDGRASITFNAPTHEGMDFRKEVTIKISMPGPGGSYEQNEYSLFRLGDRQQWTYWKLSGEPSVTDTDELVIRPRYKHGCHHLQLSPIPEVPAGYFPHREGGQEAIGVVQTVKLASRAVVRFGPGGENAAYVDCEVGFWLGRGGHWSIRETKMVAGVVRVMEDIFIPADVATEGEWTAIHKPPARANGEEEAEMEGGRGSSVLGGTAEGDEYDGEEGCMTPTAASFYVAQRARPPTRRDVGGQETDDDAWVDVDEADMEEDVDVDISELRLQRVPTRRPEL